MWRIIVYRRLSLAFLYLYMSPGKILNELNNFMTLKEITYSIFYLICFGLAIWTGFSRGFTDTHTPPMPFLIELLTLALGTILLFIDIFNKKLLKTFTNFKVHIIGLTLNGLVMIYVLSFALQNPHKNFCPSGVLPTGNTSIKKPPMRRFSLSIIFTDHLVLNL